MMRKITLFLLLLLAVAFGLALVSLTSHAQNIEGQIIASQFGQFQVPGSTTGSFQFAPDSCQVSGGGKNFAAFATGRPIKIIDGNPAHTEIATPSSVYINGCTVNMATTYTHVPPYQLTSGTGGLQEAITNGPVKGGGPNTIILNADWYSQVAPGNPGTVISSVQGNTNVGLVDVTVTPYVWYQWNGTQYVAVSPGGGGGLTPVLATYSTIGLAPNGRAYVVPAQITGGITDAFAAINAAGAQLPSTGGTIDATGLGSATYTVTTQLTALNVSNKPVTLLLDRATKFLINTSFTTPSDSPASCAVPVGGTVASGSSIIATGQNSLVGNFAVGPSAKVWDVVCNGSFTGNQQSIRLDGVSIQGNPSAAVSGSLLHLQGLFAGTRVANSGTFLCYANCVEIDPGSSQTLSSDLVFDNDNFADTATSGTYPGAVVSINALTSSGSVDNIVFIGGAIQNNGPHNPLLVVNGQGGPQLQGLTFYNVDFELSPAATSGSWSNVDPIQITDASNVLFSNLRMFGTINSTFQTHAVDLTQTISNNTYGFSIQNMTAFSSSGWACLVNNTVNGDCETGFSTGHGDLALNYQFGGNVVPQITQSNVAPPGGTGTCVIGSLWTNSAGTGPSNTVYACIGTSGSQSYQSIGSGGGAGTPGGSNTQIQYNCSGAFCGSTLLFDPTTKDLTLGPNGTTAGSASGSLLFNSLYNNGSGLSTETYDFHVQIGSGVNPFSQLVIDAPSGSPGGSEVLVLPQMHFAGGAQVQSGSTMQIVDLTPSSHVCTDAFSNLTTASCAGGGGGGGSAVTPQNFGGFGDAATVSNGCTTNGTTNIVCPVGPFTSTLADAGKLVCVQGAGAAGIGFCSAIVTVTSSTTAVVAATPSISLTQAPAVFGHDDVVAIQSCFNYSGANNVQCALNPIGVFVNTSVGYLIYSAGLTIPTHSNIMGNATYGGTTIFSEFNGDAFSLPTSTASLAAGQPVSGVTMSNIDIIHDPTWPNGRGIHLNAVAGIFGFGGMYYATFNSVADEGAALEALWMDGHTNAGGDDNPNQYIIFNNCIFNGPDQPHPAAEIKMTGIQAQILFNDGAINGTSNAHYPNPLIFIGEKTTNGGDSPAAVTFFEFTYEVGTQGLFVGNGATSIHFDNGYVESVESPLIVQGNVQGLTFKGNNIANSGNVGAVAQFSSSSSITATLQDNRAWGATAPAAFAVCTGGTNNFAIDFLNNLSNPSNTSSCVTNHAGTGAALFQTSGTTVTVDPSSTAITTILDQNVQPGKTLTLYALSGGVGSFSLGSGGTPSGNAYPINLGPYASPLVITAGNSVTLQITDQGSYQYTVVGGTDLPAAVVASSETVATSANPVWSPSFSTTYMALSGNVTGPTIAAGADGQHKTLCFKQGAGPYTVASPTNVHGFFTIGTTNGDYNCQSFVYNAANSIWLADGPGVINQ